MNAKFRTVAVFYSSVSTVLNRCDEIIVAGTVSVVFACVLVTCSLVPVRSVDESMV